MLDSPTILDPALAVLSLRNIQRGQKPHASLLAIRYYHAFCQLPPGPVGKVRTFKIPPPSKASVDTLLAYFEPRATPEEFREAPLNRAFNLRREREFGREAARA
jgi:hypothetical protein